MSVRALLVTYGTVCPNVRKSFIGYIRHCLSKYHKISKNRLLNFSFRVLNSICYLFYELSNVKTSFLSLSLSLSLRPSHGMTQNQKYNDTCTHHVSVNNWCSLDNVKSTLISLRTVCRYTLAYFIA